MAAPHVSGLAALALSANPKLTTSQLISSNTVNVARNSDKRGKANATTTVTYAASEVVGMTTNHRVQEIASEVNQRFISASNTQQSSYRITKIAAPTGPRNSAIDRYFDAFDVDSESQFDASGLVDLQDFA